jgi:hypothetical protein
MTTIGNAFVERQLHEPSIHGVEIRAHRIAQLLERGA